MSIDAINPLLQQLSSVKESVKPKSNPAAAGSEGGGFAEMLQDALKEVNQLQTDADAQIEGITLKKDGVTPHSAMVALEKADVAFQLMSAIRGKIIRAYEEVIRTQV